MNQSVTNSENEKPLITFALFAYNQEQFIAEAVQGALSQTYSPLEIILSDDCSPDRTFEIMQEMVSAYEGPHTVALNHNKKNMGLADHINHVMGMVKGEWIVVAAGDDISLPDRVAQIYHSCLTSNKPVRSVYSNLISINHNGEPLKAIKRIPSPQSLTLHTMAERQLAVPGSTQAWHCSLFDVFGNLSPRVLSEDVVIPFRARLLGDIKYIDKPLVKYRTHTSNMWGIKNISDFAHLHRCRIENLIGIWETKSNDVDVAIIKFPECIAELSLVRSILEKRLTQIYLEQEYFNLTFSDRVLAFGRLLFSGIPLSRLARWTLQYNFPKLYYALVGRYRKLRLLITRE